MAEETAVLEVKDATAVPQVNAEENAGNAGDPQANANAGETKRPGGFQRKIAKLEQENEFWKAEALKRAQASETKTAAAAPAEDPEPKEEDFATTGEYIKAVRAYDKKQNEKLVDAKLADREKSQSAQSENQKRLDAYAEKAKAFATETPDFEETLAAAAHLMVTPAMHEVLMESDHGPALAYYLATHEEEAVSITKMSPALAARAMGKIEASLAQEKPATEEADVKPPPLKTAAPAPPTPIRKNSSAPAEPDLEKVPFKEFVKIREAQQKKGK